MSRPSVDFNAIKPGHEDIDKRLRNWARWCRGGGAGSTSPMFRLYRSSDARAVDVEVAAPPCDTLDATAVQKGVNGLPIRYRHAINWHYVTGESPRRVAQRVGESLEGLARMVSDGRAMLIDRRV